MANAPSRVVLDQIRSMVEAPAHRAASDADLLEAFVARRE